MAPRETENNAYAKFWGDKQRTLWYVMVFLEWSIQSSFFTLNKHSVRSLSATRASDHFKLCAYLLSSYEYLV